MSTYSENKNFEKTYVAERLEIDEAKIAFYINRFGFLY